MSRKPPKRMGKSTPVVSDEENEQQEVTLESIFEKLNVIDVVKDDIQALKHDVTTLLGVKKELTALTDRVDAQSLDLEGATNEIRRVDQVTNDIQGENVELNARVDRPLWLI